MTQSTPGADRLVTVFGGGGFVGRHVVRALARDGWRVRVASRRPDLAFHLQPLGRVGQVHAVQANVRYPASVASALRGAAAAINLTGVLTPHGRQNFDAVHAFGARIVARAAREAGVETFAHMSALGADGESASAYARSKAAGEAAVREAFPAASILRPSIVFGPEDGFFNRFAAIARMSPVLPLIGGGQTNFQPVYVGDVANVAASLLAGEAPAGKVWELGGPAVKTFEELLRYICDVTGRKRLFAPVPAGVMKVGAFVTELANTLSLGVYPDWLTITRDQVTLLGADNVVSAQARADGRTLEGLGVTPESIESITPGYLYRFRKAGQFERQRA